MRRYLGALAGALVFSGMTVLAQNQLQDVQMVGCLRLWRPITDPAKTPSERQPGVAATYLLTPFFTTVSTAAIVPTYLLQPSVAHSFWHHVGHKVEITGTALPSPSPAMTPSQRPEETPTTDGMPRLTVSGMTMVSESCP